MSYRYKHTYKKKKFDTIDEKNDKWFDPGNMYIWYVKWECTISFSKNDDSTCIVGVSVGHVNTKNKQPTLW